MEKLFDSKPLETNQVSPTCLYHIWKTVVNLLKRSPWALHMLDATSKIPDGALEGNIMNFGSYEECLNVDVREDWGSFTGHHCLALYSLELGDLKINISLPEAAKKMKRLAVGFSLCIPSTCSPGDLQYGLSKISKNLIVEPLLCHTRNKPPLHTLDWIAIFIFLSILFLCIFSTCYDILLEGKEKRNKLLISFSFYSNGKNLFSTRSTPGSLLVLHGIRFLSIAWVILGHVTMLASVTPSVNFLGVLELGRTWIHAFHISATLSVDTFFLLSGLLLSYVFMKAMESGRQFNLFIFYLHRILRVTPVLAILILFQSSNLHRYGNNGPFFDFVAVKKGQEPCLENWWSTLLFVQNYVNPLNRCVSTSWFLAVDMQLYLISPLILFGLLKKPRITYGFIAIAIVLGIIILFMDSYMIEASPNFIRPNFKMVASYYQTHTRYIPWIVGITLGYILYKTTDWRAKAVKGDVQLPTITVICGWTFAVLCTVGSILSIHPFSQKTYVYNVVEASLYFALTRPLWSLGIAWIIFACESGYGGIANAILCWPAFRPLSRLTFCIYLIHFETIVFIIFTMRVNPYVNDSKEIGIFCDALVISILGAIVLTLLLEAPIIGLEKILLQKDQNMIISQISTNPENVNQQLHNKNKLVSGNSSRFAAISET